MAVPKKPEPMAPRSVQVPRAWLAVALVLLTAPWVVVGALYLRTSSPAVHTPVATVTEGPTVSTARGPWGHLKATPITVSPPIEYVAADWGRPDEPYRWYFPGAEADIVRAFLTSSGMSPEHVNRLVSRAQHDARIRGTTIQPDLDVLKALEPQVRARVYTKLAMSQLNGDQINSFRFFGTPEAWFAGARISPQTRQLVESLIYRDGDILHFADAAIVRAEITDAAERQRLAKMLLRQSTMLVRLSVTQDSEIPALVQYWGRGGRSTDIRPLLESVAGASEAGFIDIVHLLPSFARNRLYRYPKLTTADLDKPLLANCLWSSLNFFSGDPDDRFLDVDTALATLRHDYHIVEADYQLGDIIGFLDAEGDLYHVAVYIADDLLFTKNGMSPVSPWTIMPLERVKDYYRAQSDTPRLIYHRRNDF
jgi:hypothetical protein